MTELYKNITPVLLLDYHSIIYIFAPVGYGLTTPLVMNILVVQPEEYFSVTKLSGLLKVCGHLLTPRCFASPQFPYISIITYSRL